MAWPPTTHQDVQDAVSTLQTWSAMVTPTGQQRLATSQDSRLLRARAALALAGSQRVNVLFVGHSMVSGYKVTSYKDQLHNTFAVAARRRLGLGSDGGAWFHAQKGTLYTGITDWPYTLNASILGASGHGLPMNSAAWVHPTLGSHVVAVPAGITGIIIHTASNSAQPGGTFTYQIDAGTAVTVNTSADAQADYDFRRATTVTLDGAAHTVTIVGTVGYTTVMGVEFTRSDATSGVHVFADGHPGYTTTQMLTSLLTDYTGASGATLNHFNPALIVFTGLVNDYSAGTDGANPVSSATSASNLATLLEGLADACATRPSIVVNIEHQRGTNTMTEPWDNYVTAAYQVADANGYAVFDGGKRFGTLPTPAGAVGLLDADLIHPAPAGMWDWGYGLAALVTPS